MSYDARYWMHKDIITTDYLNRIERTIRELDTAIANEESNRITVTFKTYDGNSTIAIAFCIDGVPQFIPLVPTREPVGQYRYVGVGWNTQKNADTNDDSVLQNVADDIIVYAAYTIEERKYTVTWKNADGTILETDNEVSYNAIPSYNGVIPSYNSMYPIEWEPSIGAVKSDITYTAVYPKEITDSWNTIIANIDNNTYSTKYKIGDYKPLDLGVEGIVNMQIVGMDVDKNVADEKVPLTFISMELLNSAYKMNPLKEDGHVGTGTLGGWSQSDMQGYLEGNVLPLIQSNITNRINYVSKTSNAYDSNEDRYQDVACNKLWIPSHREIFNSSNYDESGPVYSSIYKNRHYNPKKRNNTVSLWWLRTAYDPNYFCYVSNDGNLGAGSSNEQYGICIGFCLGHENSPTPPN